MTHLTKHCRVFVLLLVSFFAFAPAAFAGCGIVCTEPDQNGEVERGDFYTNACLSGTGTLDTTTCDGGSGGDTGGGGGGGGGSSSYTDLTTSSISPTSATSGVTQTYYATVYNGAANAGNTVTLFQRTENPGDVSTPVVGTIQTASMNAYSSRTVSVSYAHSGGSFYMRACADGYNQVAESNESNNCGAWTYITVMPEAPQNQADLTAGKVSVSGVTAGSASTFSSLASNIGQATSGNFPLLFQVNENGALFNSASIAGLAAGASAQGSGSYTFSSAGTYTVRACANYDTSWNTVTSESDTSNNCGPWTEVTINPAQTPALSCSVSPTTVGVGGSATYSANPSGGASGPYTWTASDGGSYGTGVSVTRSFATAGTYGMNVDTSGTAVSYCPNVSVVSTACSAATTDLTITATPSRVRAGQSATIAWSASGVNGEGASCSVSGPGVSWTSTVSTAPQCSAEGSATTNISTQSTYTMTCAGASESVVVNVIPQVVEF